MRAALMLLALGGCAAAAGAPPVAVISAACSVRPVTVSSRDFLSPATIAEIRRVNRELRQHCSP